MDADIRYETFSESISGGGVVRTFVEIGIFGDIFVLDLFEEKVGWWVQM